MMSSIKIGLALAAAAVGLLPVQAQNAPGAAGTAWRPKFSLNGHTRAAYTADAFRLAGDTTTLPRENSGHVLADLGMNVRPNDQTEVQAMIRVRNDYGGFWGSGVSFDVRQLTVKGLINNRFRYALGDLDYKLTPFTMQRTAPLLQAGDVLPSLELFQRALPGNDVWMNPDGTWRTQGASVEWGLRYKKGPESHKTNLFAFRLRPALGGAQTEQWASGGRTALTWKTFFVGANAVLVQDVPGTSAATLFYRNAVATLDAGWALNNRGLKLKGEGGISRTEWALANAPAKGDYFYHMTLSGAQRRWSIGYRDIGPDFFSPSAQTTAYNLTNVPGSFSRTGNDRMLRTANLMDLHRETSLYRTAWNPTLGAEPSVYLTMDPFGVATPNRRGLSAEWNPTPHSLAGKPMGPWNLQLKADWASEIRGQGTAALTQFARLDALGGWSNKNWSVRALLRWQRTWRTDAGENVPNYALSQPWLKANVGYRLRNDLRLDAGLWTVQSTGYAFQSVRDAQNQVVDFTGGEVNYREWLPVASLTYQPFDKTQLVAGWMANRTSSEAVAGPSLSSAFVAYIQSF